MTCRWYKSCVNCRRSSKCCQHAWQLSRRTYLCCMCTLAPAQLAEMTHCRGRKSNWNYHVVHFLSAFIKMLRIWLGARAEQNTPHIFASLLLFFFTFKLRGSYISSKPGELCARRRYHIHIYIVRLSGYIDLKNITLLRFNSTAPNSPLWLHGAGGGNSTPRHFVPVADPAVHYNMEMPVISQPQDNVFFFFFPSIPFFFREGGPFYNVSWDSSDARRLIMG